MKSLFDEGPSEPCPSPFNMAAHVLAAGQSCPEKDALLILSRDGAERWSYADLRRAVLGTATGLLSLGFSRGDIVLMRLGNTVDFPVAYLGALAAGLLPVPSSSALTETETAYLIDVVKPAAILHAPEIHCPPFPRLVSLADMQGFRALPAASFDFGDPDRPGYIIFTSGTAGRPRAVVHAHRAIWARRMMFDGWYGLTSEDRVLHAGAFNWTYTMGTGLMDPWTAGATALIPAPGTPLARLPTLLKKHNATIFAAAPGVYRQMLNACDVMDVPGLRHGLSAGEKLPLATAERWRAATDCPVLEAYGMSECSTFISQAPGVPMHCGSLGRPQKGRRIALLKDGAPVPLGTEGMIAISARDPGLMLGYLEPDGTIDRPLEGEWFVTGDQAVMERSGDITYKGRNDDMMNAGGYRVSPIEVETVLAHHPGISAVAATSVTVKRDTEVIAAFYTGPAALDETELQAYVSTRLARYKQPRLYIHLAELPLGANGKILRRVLRRHFERTP